MLSGGIVVGEIRGSRPHVTHLPSRHTKQGKSIPFTQSASRHYIPSLSSSVSNTLIPDSVLGIIIAMHPIYESSPRRSPRHIHPSSENVLKPKSDSPIRKSASSKNAQSSKKVSTTKTALSSSKALANAPHDDKQKRRKNAQVNDENKENCGAERQTQGARRTEATVGINGSTLQKNSTQPTLRIRIDPRTPLKELPLNGFVDKLKKDGIRSVEIMVFPVFGFKVDF